MFSDTALTATSIGLFTLVALRWKTIPEDIRAVQLVFNYLIHFGCLQFKRASSFSSNVDFSSHYPRPPRTALPPTPPRNYQRNPPDDCAPAGDVASDNSSDESAAEAKELDLKEDKGDSVEEEGETGDETKEERGDKEEEEEREEEEEGEREEAEREDVH